MAVTAVVDYGPPSVEKMLGALPVVRDFLRRLDVSQVHWDMTVRHEALSDRAGVEGPRRLAVAAAG
ncbi:hypothetical protein [Frankia canadensis]|uniref:hypothetical protein n=1 Tax=Frankia canadensis TaxID=1836972 RepID=UPI0010565F00|nr:hypothetical protein [Frankia canadensis]